MDEKKCIICEVPLVQRPNERNAAFRNRQTCCQAHANEANSRRQLERSEKRKGAGMDGEITLLFLGAKLPISPAAAARWSDVRRSWAKMVEDHAQ